MRKTILVILVILISAVSLQAAEAEDVVYSVLFPGWGQLRAGRYSRGALLMGVEMITLTGLAVVNIQYDREVEAYDRAKLLYNSAMYVGDARAYYDQMVEKWDAADNMDRYRKVFVGTAVGVWVIGVADMIWGKEASNPPISFEVRGDGFLVAKSFSF